MFHLVLFFFVCSPLSFDQYTETLSGRESHFFVYLGSNKKVKNWLEKSMKTRCFTKRAKTCTFVSISEILILSDFRLNKCSTERCVGSWLSPKN